MLYIIFILILLTVCINRTAFAATGFSYQELGRLNVPSNQQASNRWLSVDYEKTKDFKSEYSSHMKFHLRHLGQNGAIFSAPEAYIRVDRGNTQMIYGRQILNWSPQEKFWLLGDLNSQRGFNLLEEDQEGLAGIHLVHQQDFFKLELFGSYLYVPQLNPGYKIKNGEVKAPTEWSKLPPKKVFYNNAEVPIYYELEAPEMKTILFQPTIGGRLNMNWSEKGGVSAYGLYKPENQVRLNATGHYEQDQEEQARVKAKPFANHQWIYGLEADQEFGDITAQVGTMIVIPERGKDPTFEFEPLKIEPIYEDYYYGFGSLTYKKSDIFVSLHHIESFSPPAQGDNLFGKKIRWQSATGIKSDYMFNDHWSFNVTYRYDWEMQDRLLVQAVTYRVDKDMSASLGLEMLDAPNNNSFWSSYRSNDTSYARFNYQF